MSVAGVPSFRSKALFVVLSGACFFATLGLRPLEEHDSLRFPEVAREILETGDWAVLHLHGVPYLLKPPLQFWLVALTGRAAGGIHPWVARLPSAIGGWGMVLLTAWIGTFLAGPRAGLLAGVVLGTGVLFFTLSQMTRLDPLYSFFILLAMALYVRWRGVPGAFRGPGGIARTAAVFAALGLAGMVKGPMALVFVLPVLVADAVIRRDGSFFRPGSFLPALALYAGLLLPWVLPVLGHIGGTEMRELFQGEIGDRLGGGQNYDQPWWHYLRGVPIDFLPWSWFFPAAAWIAWKRRGRPFPLPPVLLLWSVLPLAILSCAVSKNTRYLLPVFPAFALVLGILLARPWEEADELDAPLLAWARAVPVGAITFGLGCPLWFWSEGPPWWTWAAGLTLVTGSAWVLAGDRRRHYLGALAWTAAIALGWYQAQSVHFAVRESPRGSYARAAAHIGAVVGDRPLASWRFGEESVEFYCRRIIPQFDTPDRLAAFLRDHPGARVLAEPHGIAGLAEVPGFLFEERALIPERKKQPFVVLEPLLAGD